MTKHKGKYLSFSIVMCALTLPGVAVAQTANICGTGYISTLALHNPSSLVGPETVTNDTVFITLDSTGMKAGNSQVKTISGRQTISLRVVTATDVTRLNRAVLALQHAMSNRLPVRIYSNGKSCNIGVINTIIEVCASESTCNR